jgi:hypothetical protein
MGNVLSEYKKQQVVALGRLGWSIAGSRMLTRERNGRWRSFKDLVDDH